MNNKFLAKILFLVITICGCQKSNKTLLLKLENEIKNNTEKAIKAGERYTVIDIKEIVDFDWEKMYVFDNYMDDNQISSHIGFTWSGPTVRNDHWRLLFIKNNQVVSYVDYAYFNLPIYFYQCEDEIDYTKSEAKFFTTISCDGLGNKVFPFIPASCFDGDQDPRIQSDCD